MKAPRANQTTLLRTAAGGQYDDESAEEQPPTQSAASPHFNERGTDRCQKVECGVLEAVLEPVLESVQNKSRLGYLRIATASLHRSTGRAAWTRTPTQSAYAGPYSPFVGGAPPPQPPHSQSACGLPVFTIGMWLISTCPYTNLEGMWLISTCPYTNLEGIWVWPYPYSFKIGIGYVDISHIPSILV